MSEGEELVVQEGERLGLFKALASFFKKAIKLGGKDAGKEAEQGLADIGKDLEKGWAKDGLSLDREANAEVDAFFNRATEAEPGLTRSMTDIGETVPGAKLEGLQYRLKEADSLKRKVATDLLENPNMTTGEALADIKDSVRYTMTMPDEGYVSGANQAVSELQARGFENVSWKPTWEADGYKGINSAWRDPATGQVFEVQFHTPASFEAKMTTHDLYNVIRLPDTPPDVKAALIQQQNEIFNAVPIPPGLSGLWSP